MKTIYISMLLILFTTSVNAEEFKSGTGIFYMDCTSIEAAIESMKDFYKPNDKIPSGSESEEELNRRKVYKNSEVMAKWLFETQCKKSDKDPHSKKRPSNVRPTYEEEGTV